MTPRDMLSDEQRGLLAETREAVRGKMDRHSRHAARKMASGSGGGDGGGRGGRGHGGGSDRGRGRAGSETSASDASSGGEGDGSSESEGNLDSYRALYSARKM